MKIFQKYRLTLILLLGLVVRLVHLNQSFWLDEAAQVIESARPLSEQLHIAGDFQPPLFHLLLHFWMKAGTNELWIRLLPILFSLLTIYIVYLFGKQLKNQIFGVFVAFLLAIAPYHVYYSQEVRPYALSAFMGILATYFLFKKKFIAYCMSGALFLYTIYLAPFLIFAHAIWIFLFHPKHLKSFLLSLFGMGLLFAPWIPFFMKQLRIGTSLTSTLPGWNVAVSPALYKSLPLIFTKFLLGRISIDQTIVYGGIVIILFSIFLYVLHAAWQSQKKRTIQISILFAIPILTAFIISFFVPILAPQRVLFTLPFFLGIIAMGIQSLPKKHQIAFVSGICILSSFSLWLYYTQPRFQREQWRQAVSYVEQESVPHSLAIFVFPDPFAPWQWYEKGIVEAIGVAPHFVLTPDDLSENTSFIVNHDKVFLFQYLTDLTDPNNMMITFLERAGFVQSNVQNFSGVGFIYTYEKYFAQN